MKIAIVSDLHIGHERFGDDAYRQARLALEEASRIADAIILPGDIFDRRTPAPNVIAQAINLFRDVGKSREWTARVSLIEGASKKYTDIPLIAIPGTHERSSEGKENPLQLLSLAGLLVDVSESTAILEKDGERVAVYGLGGISEERVRDRLKEINPTPKKGMFNIFMFHQSIYEYLPFSDDFLRLKELPKGFDLYVDGHIHNRIEEKIFDGKPLIIPGSTVLTQLKESEQEDKGFILFDTVSGAYEFKVIASREFAVRRISIEDATPKEVTERCERAINEVLSKKRPGKPIIKLYLEGRMMQGYETSDMMLSTTLQKYSDSALIDVDSSKLAGPELASGIEEVRESRIGNVSIKEAGMGILKSKLKEANFEGGFDYVELFSILSTAQNKEKAVKEALNFLLQEKH